jgi:hypothetical protein
MAVDDADFLALEARDDSGRTLFDLMRDENLKINDLLRLRRQYEKHGQWKYKSAPNVERIKAIAATARRKLEDEEDDDDDGGGGGGEGSAAAAMAAAAAAAAAAGVSATPLPRTKEVCAWKGYDADGNLYWCNNRTFTHPRTHFRFEHCGHHLKECVGAHPNGTVPIVTPNEFALCYTHFVADHGFAPRALESELLVPGIVFARAGTKRNPLAPARKEKKKRTDGSSDEEDDDDGGDDGASSESDGAGGRRKKAGGAAGAGKKKKKQKQKRATRVQLLMQRFFNAVKLPSQLLAERNKAACVIQARVRALIARRVVERMKREILIQDRHRAATMVQNAFKRIANVKKRQRMFVEMHGAAAVIQRYFRYRTWQRKVARDRNMRRASVRLQRWWRLRQMKSLLRILYIRQTARASASHREVSLVQIKKLTRVWKFKRVIRNARVKRRREDRASGIIGRAYRRYKGQQMRSEAARQRAYALKLMRATLVIQKLVRAWVRRREGWRYRRRLLRAAATIRRVARGHLGRLEARRKRARIEAVWAWLNPTLPRELYAEYLGFPDYDRMFDLSRFTYKEKTPRDGGGGGGRGGGGGCGGRGGAEEEKKGGSGDDDGEEEDDEARFVRRSKEVAMSGGTSSASYEVTKAFATLTGRTAKLDGAGLKKALAAQLAEKKRVEEEKATAEQRAIERRSRAPIPMGREHGMDAPNLLVSLTGLVKAGRRPMEAPPPSSLLQPTSEEKGRTLAYIARLEEAFFVADREARGVLPVQVFARVLASQGADMAPRLMGVLADTFTAVGSNKVSYAQYIEFARKLDRPCAVHRVLVCPACIYKGPCDKCLCKRYDAAGDTSEISNPHSELCTCGHHKNRHAPAMKVHPQPDMSGAGGVGRVATVDAALSKTGKGAGAGGGAVKGQSSADLVAMGVGDRVFLPLPVSIAETVEDFHSRGALRRPGEGMERGEAYPTQDMDDGIGSAPWRAARDDNLQREARATGKKDAGLPGAKGRPGAERVVKGTTVQETVAIGALPTSGSGGGGGGRAGAGPSLLSPLKPVAASKYAALEALMDDIDRASASGSASRPGTGGAPLRISESLPMGAVANLPLADLRAANDTLKDVLAIAERTAIAGMATVVAGTKKALAQSRRDAEGGGGGGGGAGRGADGGSHRGSPTPQAAAAAAARGHILPGLKPYDPPAQTLYDRAMDELDRMTDYGESPGGPGGGGWGQLDGRAGLGTRGTFATSLTSGSYPLAVRGNAHGDDRYDDDDGDYFGGRDRPETVGTWTGPQPRLGSPPSPPHSANAGDRFTLSSPVTRGGKTVSSVGQKEREEDGVAYDGRGSVVLAVPRMTPLETRRRRDKGGGRTPPYTLHNRAHLDSVPDGGTPVLVPALFVHAMAAGADVAGGAAPPTAQTTGTEMRRAHILQQALARDAEKASRAAGPSQQQQQQQQQGGGRGGASSRSWSPLGGRDGSAPARAAAAPSRPGGGRPPAPAPPVSTTSAPDASARAMFTYLLLLRTLAAPSADGSGYDVVADPSRLLQLILDHHAFLLVYWKDLVTDLRTGRLMGGPSGVLTPDQRRALGQVLAPNAGRAAFLDQVFRTHGLAEHRVALAGGDASGPSGGGTGGRAAPAAGKGGSDVAAAAADLFFARAYSSKELEQLRDPAQPMPARKGQLGPGTRTVASPDSFPIPRRRVGDDSLRLEDDEEGGARGPPGGAVHPPPHVGGLGSRAARAMAAGRAAGGAGAGGGVKGTVSPYFSAPATGPVAAEAVRLAEATPILRPSPSSRQRRRGSSSADGGTASSASGASPPDAAVFSEADLMMTMMSPEEAGALAARDRRSVSPPVGGGGGGWRRAGTGPGGLGPRGGRPVPVGLASALASSPAAAALTFSGAGGLIPIPLPPTTDADLAGAGRRVGGGRPAHPFDPAAFSPTALELHPGLMRETRVDRTAEERAADSAFYVVQGPRPFGCRHPGCGQLFGSMGAAIRHLREAHRGVLPLFTPSESDAYLRGVWDAAGLKADGWLPAPAREVPTAAPLPRRHAPAAASLGAAPGTAAAATAKSRPRYLPVDSRDRSRPAASELRMPSR